MDESKDRTLWVGNVAEEATEELLYELFLQAGPLEKVTIPKDRETQKQKNFAFITFRHELSVPFCINVFDGVYLKKRRLQLKTRNGSVHTSGKDVDPSKWGIGLLPHPSIGVGLIKPKNMPAKTGNKDDSRNANGNNSPNQYDKDNNNGDDSDARRVVFKTPSSSQAGSFLSFTPVGSLLPPPPPMGHPPHSGYQGQNQGQRNFRRSQTWSGEMELPGGFDSETDGSHQRKEKYDSRFNNNDTREVKRRKFEENPHSNDRYSRGSSRNGSYERQRSHERGESPVESQLHQMAQMQLQMIQQQQQQQQRGHSYGGSSQHYSGGQGHRRY